MLKDLEPNHEDVKSYYGKAVVQTKGDEKTLYSYETRVAKIKNK